MRKNREQLEKPKAHNVCHHRTRLSGFSTLHTETDPVDMAEAADDVVRQAAHMIFLARTTNKPVMEMLMQQQWGQTQEELRRKCGYTPPDDKTDWFMAKKIMCRDKEAERAAAAWWLLSCVLHHL